MSATSRLDLTAREVGRSDALLGIRPTSDREIMRYVLDLAGIPRRWDADLFDQVIDAYCEAYHEAAEER